jgi:hypothetical protein
MKFDPKKHFDPKPRGHDYMKGFKWLMKLPDLSANAKAVYMAFADTTFGNGFSSVTNEYVAQAVGTCVRTVHNGIVELKAYGLIERHRMGGARRSATIFLRHPTMDVEVPWERIDTELSEEEVQSAKDSDSIGKVCRFNRQDMPIGVSHKPLKKKKVTAEIRPPKDVLKDLSKDYISQSSTAEAGKEVSTKESPVSSQRQALPLLKKDGAPVADVTERKFWNRWCEEYLKTVGTACMESYGPKIIKMIRSIRERTEKLPHGREELGRMIDRYLKDRDDFVLKGGRSIMIFGASTIFVRYTDATYKAIQAAKDSPQTTIVVNQSRRLD